MDVALKVSNVSYRSQGRGIVNDVSFSLNYGRILALVGPNGAGKTTLLRCLSGYYQPSSGKVQLQEMGRNRARALAYMPQSAPATMAFTVEQAVILGRKPYMSLRISSKDRAMCDAVLHALELEGLRNHYIDRISAGEYQRVMLARTIAQDTGVMLLDEPLNNLDPAQQLKVLTLLNNLAKDKFRAIIVSMHDLSLTARYCHEVLLMAHGRVLALGRPEEVLSGNNLALAYNLQVKVEKLAEGQMAFIPFLK